VVKVGPGEEIVNDGSDLVVRQNLECPVGDIRAFVYGTLTAISKMEADKAKDTNEKFRNLLASLSGEPQVLFTKLKGVDWSTAEVVASLFFVI
jgi:hypothetical protein